MLHILRPESVSHSPRPVLVAFVQNHVFSSSQGGSKVVPGTTKSSQEFFQASDPQARLRGRHSFHPELVSTTGLEFTLFEGFTGQTQGCLDSVKGDKPPPPTSAPIRHFDVFSLAFFVACRRMTSFQALLPLCPFLEDSPCISFCPSTSQCLVQKDSVSPLPEESTAFPGLSKHVSCWGPELEVSLFLAFEICATGWLSHG